MLIQCMIMLMLYSAITVESLLQVRDKPPTQEMFMPPTLDPYGDGSATGPRSPWRSAPKISQKSALDVTYPRKARVNLDLPPRERLKEIAVQYRDEILPYDMERAATLRRHTEIDQKAWAEALEAQFPREYLEELRGVVDIMNHPAASWEQTLLAEALYELGSPIACSNILMATRDGTVLHGRNLDYKLESPIIEITYMRKGQPSFIVPQFAGSVGMPTVIKPGHWAIAQDTRIELDDTPWNTLKRVKAGAKIFPMLLRTYADSDLEYDEVVARLREVALVRSSYFILSGAAPFQGTIITRWWDPSFRHIQDLSSTGRWYAVQTNDDSWSIPLDLRRGAALRAMSALNQSAVSPETMIKIMHSPPLFVDSMNIYLFIMSVKSGKFCTVLGPTTTNDDTSVDCHMDGWNETLPADVSAWSRWTW